MLSFTFRNKTKMEIIKLILTFLFGIFMIGNGMYHFSKPDTYFPFIPNFLPKEAINYLVALIEILVGMSVFIPQTRQFGVLIILIMMIAFLPIHIIDAFRQNPLIGTKQIAFQRLGLQLIFVLWAWYIHRT
jgi:uncharacterized membrane protein